MQDMELDSPPSIRSRLPLCFLYEFFMGRTPFDALPVLMISSLR